MYNLKRKSKTRKIGGKEKRKWSQVRTLNPNPSTPPQEVNIEEETDEEESDEPVQNLIGEWSCPDHRNDEDENLRWRIVKFSNNAGLTNWTLQFFDDQGNGQGDWIDVTYGADGEGDIIVYSDDDALEIQILKQRKDNKELDCEAFMGHLLSGNPTNLAVEGLLNLPGLEGGFFFNKKKTRKRRKKKTRKKKNKKKKTLKKKDRKWTDTSYPYRTISNQEAIDDFLALKRMAKGDINPSSLAGNKTVDWGTERARRKTKYRNHSFIEMWNRKDRRKKMMEFARRVKKKDPKRSIEGCIRSAIDLQWGTVNTMRAAAAVQMYKKYKATRVLDFTAGWGARMIAAMALDIDYIGIDTNTDLKPGYAKIIKLLKPYTKSKVKMIWKEAQKVKYSKLGKYDYVFTSPPYEYLEAYENMTNYEKKGSKIVQPSSSQKIKMDDSAKFYEEFLVPTLKKAYKYLPRNKFICLNMPDIMYDKIKSRWKKVTKCEDYKIIKRTGGPIGKNRRGKELIYCWKKR